MGAAAKKTNNQTNKLVKPNNRYHQKLHMYTYTHAQTEKRMFCVASVGFDMKHGVCSVLDL
jgi:hypothetical protein